MDIADDIAYGIHDLEDAIALGLVTERMFREYVEEECCGPFLDYLRARERGGSSNDLYEDFVRSLFLNSDSRKHSINRLNHHFITNISIYEENFEEPLLKYRAKINEAQRVFLDKMQDLVSEKVIKSPKVQHLEFKGQHMVVSVFEALKSDPRTLLPDDFHQKYRNDAQYSRVDRVGYNLSQSPQPLRFRFWPLLLLQ